MGLVQRQEETAENQQQIAKFYSFREEKSFYRKVYMNWDSIERANKNDNAFFDRTKLLSERAKNIASIVVGKLGKGNIGFFNHKYLSKITKCTRRQNLRIIDQLRDVFEIIYHNTVTHNGKKYRHCYEFSFKSNNPINTPNTKSSTGTRTSRNEETLYIYKENKLIEDIDLVTSSLRGEENAVQIRAKDSNLQDNSPTKNKPDPNKRKKPTNAEKKARIYRPLFNNQYPQLKNLAEHYPLTAEDCSTLQIRSGRDFNLNAMNEILLALANKPKASRHEFPSKEAFLAYMSKIYRYEKRDAVVTSKINYKIKANMTESDITEQTTFAQREKFLNKIEQEAITHVSSMNQLNAKIASALPPSIAYDFLSRLKHFYVDGEVLEAHLTSAIELSYSIQQMIIKEANAVGYTSVNSLEMLYINHDWDIAQW